MGTVGDAEKVDAVKMFHDYVLENYKDQEIGLTEVAGRFWKETGYTLTLFLGKYSSYEKLDEFKNWFDSNRVSATQVKITAKPGKATLIPGVDIVSSIKAKIEEQHSRVQTYHIGAPVLIPNSWEDYFRTNDVNCFLGVIEVKPSTENPGNTWIRLKECHDATGKIADYSFACKDEKVSGVEDGALALGRRNQVLPERPFFFAGDRVPVELVDWKELNIVGSAREFLERNHGNVHVDCECYFKDLLVVDNDMVYSGIQYSKETSEIYVGEECREGNVHHFLSESKQTCWMYLLNWGDDKGLFRLIAPKDVSGLTTKELISRVGTLLIKAVEGAIPSELSPRNGCEGNDGGAHLGDVSVGGDVLPKEDAEASRQDVIDCEEGGILSEQSVEPTETKVDLASTLNEQNSESKTSGISDIAILSELQKPLDAELNNAVDCEMGWRKEELKFLDEFSAVVKDSGFIYDERDIVRLHTSVKCGRMVVLGGAPGVGKSSIIELYSRCVGGEESSYFPIAVSPSWAEPADILGDEDFSGKFRDARCGLAQYIREAEKGFHAICFEEMNLACAEHYFSDLMQVIDKPLGEDVVIRGYDRAGFPKIDSSQELQQSPLKMAPGIRVFGTCNFDITTHPFSARFYNRCSYIELSPSVQGFPNGTARIDPAKLKNAIKAGPHIEDCECSAVKITEVVEREFKSMLGLLEPARLCPSPRVLRQMKAYIVSRPPIGDERKMSVEDLQIRALDEALAQYALAQYTPDMNLKVRNAQGELREWIKDRKFIISSHLLDEIEKRLNGLAAE